MLAPAGPPRSSGAASLVTALSLARHSCELVARTRPAGCRPLLELGDELFVRYRHRRAPAARVPTPKHQLVLADVLEQRSEVAAAVRLLAFDGRAQLGRREADPGHFMLGGWKPPVRRAGRRVRAVAGGWVRFAVAGRARQPGRPVALGPRITPIACLTPASNCSGASPGM